MVWQATIAAVSVRKRAFPKLTALKPDSCAIFISSGVKSPSGPIKIRMSFLFGIMSFKCTFLSPKQCAIKRFSIVMFFTNSEKRIAGFKVGKNARSDCFAADCKIF